MSKAIDLSFLLFAAYYFSMQLAVMVHGRAGQMLRGLKGLNSPGHPLFVFPQLRVSTRIFRLNVLTAVGLRLALRAMVKMARILCVGCGSRIGEISA
ncbi:MAG: hypothetical protein CVU16_10290 [Betaproteobacteria bacterium HGW-Betaproteobacteria-10]|nr:MAG: hypothetical protein CVU16_10290 [Betaproteobacteria bacterium HGW-Betaproteobacteria-10]